MSSSRDQRIADEVGIAQTLRCTAMGCPNAWSVSIGSRLCSAHAWADPSQWPGITQSVLDAEADRARFGLPGRQQAVRHLSAQEKRSIGARMRDALSQSGGRDWAMRLRDRDQQGEPLTDAQRHMYRAALWLDGEAIEREAA